MSAAVVRHRHDGMMVVCVICFIELINWLNIKSRENKKNPSLSHDAHMMVSAKTKKRAKNDAKRKKRMN
jgi:hypothetical protein